MPCVVERKLRTQARYAFQVEKRLHMAMHGFIAVDVAVTVFFVFILHILNRQCILESRFIPLKILCTRLCRQNTHFLSKKKSSLMLNNKLQRMIKM